MLGAGPVAGNGENPEAPASSNTGRLVMSKPRPMPTERTLTGLWDRAVARSPQAIFLIFTDDTETAQWTYAEFDLVIDAMCATLLAHGVGHGDAVHVALRNSPAFVAVWLAAGRIGSWIVPVDPASTSRDLHGHFPRIRPALGCCAVSRRDVYRGPADSHGVPVLEFSETAADVGPPDTIGGLPRTDVRPDDRLAVMFTSGTTSQPKGVILTQACYATAGRVMADAANLSCEHRWLVSLPLFHANAQYYCFAPAITVGASIALTATFSASRWIQAAHDLGATHASLFAAPIRMILARTPVNAPKLALHHVWFAQSLGAQHHQQFGRLVGVLPRQLYGMTETVAIVTADDSEPPRSDIIGRPVANRKVRLIDTTTGEEVVPGTPGMITVGGRRGHDLFSGYLDDPATTDRAFVERPEGTWFLTGDLAVADATGRMRFVGRADDVIKVAGENVSLTEVEAAIAQAPGVLEAAVIARPDPIRDHVPIAFVVALAGSAPTIADLATWAEHELPPSARPREWHFIGELPRTSVGKIRRHALHLPPAPPTPP